MLLFACGRIVPAAVTFFVCIVQCKCPVFALMFVENRVKIEKKGMSEGSGMNRVRASCKFRVWLCVLCVLLPAVLGGCSGGNRDTGRTEGAGTGGEPQQSESHAVSELPGTAADTSDHTPAPLVKIACVGDSLTWGQALNNAQSANPYPKVLQELLGTDGYLVGNFGASGRVMSEGYREATWDRSYNLTSTYQESLQFGADIVVICLGTNDAAKCDVSSEEGKQNFLNSARNLVEAYRSAGASEIYLCLPPYNSNSAYIRVLERRVMPLIRQAAQENGLELIDFYTPTNLHEEYLLSDSLHLTDAGYALMAETVFERITKDS